ncbi:hypothetical protein KCP77_01400 [Salmonella enterica subsp. enterica]|nr:hypothetical protein KCP77_01400 [Salmonella enterica subsp. enterica]
MRLFGSAIWMRFPPPRARQHMKTGGTEINGEALQRGWFIRFIPVSVLAAYSS